MSPDHGTAAPPPLELDHVTVRFGDRTVLDDVTWTVQAGERWVVLGRNGCGKTTMLRVGALVCHPTTGTVRVLGEQLGRTDVRVLRQRIGFISAAMADRFRATISAADVVMTARFAALEPWWHDYEPTDRERALALLERMGVGALADQRFATLSSGERQRVLLARMLMTEPGLLLLDEPMAGLDVGGREELVDTLQRLADDPATPPMILVTHHLEEVPPSFTHAMLMSAGRVTAAGPIDEVLTAAAVSDCFGVGLAVERTDDRWRARRVG